MNTILLVEDNIDNQLVIEDLFELDEINARFVAVDSAEEAFQRIPQVRPDLILMDIGLPGMSGLEATRRLKTDPATAPIPVWALTAHAMKKVETEALDAGCEDYLTKPIDAAELTQRLKSFLAQCPIKDAA